MLRSEILRTFVVRYGEPTAHVTDARRYIIALCIKRNYRMLQSMLDLSVLPNGDWSDRTCVETYVPLTAVVNEAELKETVANRMVGALAPKLYNVLSKDFAFCALCLSSNDDPPPWNAVYIAVVQ